jgi:hypothetical protein
MFTKNGEYISNKNEEFLKNSDLVIGWNTKGDIELSGDEKLPLLLARLAYVFELTDEEFKKHEDYEEYVDILKGIRIKDTLIQHNLTLPDVADILSKIDEAKNVSIIINDDDYDTILNFMGFGAMMGLLSGKIGLYFTELDDSEFKVFD